MDSSYLQRKHDAGLPYDRYVRSGRPEQADNWRRVYEQVQLTAVQRQLVQSFTRKLNVIALSGIWCGDCVQQLPLLAHLAQANPACIDLRFLDRDEHADLQQQVRINGGNRVPVVLFLAEDYELCGWYGDRTLSRYRAVAARQLGPSCPLPGAPVPTHELEAALGDWLNEFERVHLMLRLSPRLRQRHGD